ncbi:tape measure protein [Leuconostoc lactis]|uniref:tape measure protein n=1 Tax=Leuconostoc lactis TaxID=1246 RepID=UPI000A002AE2|nr:tape measure protein [Leuconostoc lactis]ORI85700.1 hypothetical protein BMS94_00680 [Leuconostoc lactis]ORI87964.1 hypothetical protein BMS96_00685 [Leuconostoc lactis]
MESYSVQAVLSAVDKNFSKTFESATRAADSFGNNTTKSTGIGGKGMIKFGAVAGAATAVVSKALSEVTSNVGNAVDRFDTLNKYPVVMKALGYSTQDTGKSMKLLSNGIDGLPTSLNEITSAAQQFAPLTGSATSSAKAALALNDAFLASGASVADTSRGMQQYTQMLATGKVDMQSWRTLQETMPIALRKTANAFGFTGKAAEQDLFKALQSGQITIDDLNKKFVELDQGQNGFATLARKNSVGIKTSFTNLGTAVTKGLAGTLTAIDNGLKNAKLGGIADLINKLKGSINGVFDVINGTITKVIPIVTDIFSKLMPVIKNLAPLIVGLGAGFITASVGVTALTKATNGVASAFSAIYRHPIVAIIVLLATAFYEAYVNIKPFHDFVDKLAKKIGDLANKIPKSTDALNALKTSLGILGGVVGGGILLGGFLKFKSGLDSVSKTVKNVKKPLTETAAGVGGLGKKSGGASPKLMGIATAILEIGAGVGLAAAGIGLMSLGFTKLAGTGQDGLNVITAMTVSIVAVVAAFALFAPALTAGSVGITAFGVAILAAGAGIGIAASGLALLITALNNTNLGFTQIVTTMGAIGIGFATMLTGFITTLANNMPTISAALLNMLVTFLNQVIVYGPTIVSQFATILINFLTQMTTYIPQIVQKIVDLLIAIIGKITENIPAIAESVTNLILAMLKAVGDNAPQLVAGFAAMLGELAEALIQIMPYIIELTGAIIAGMIAAVATYTTAFNEIGGVILKALIAGVTGQKYDAVGAATDIIKSSAKSASDNGVAAFKDAGGNSAISALKAIAGKKGDAKTSGSDLGKSAADGVNSRKTDAKDAGNNIGNKVADGVGTTDLSGNGESIMGGFLSGLQGTNWGRVMGFVGSVAGWIANHKGPIQYDRKLLIPAGNAIMNGLNAGLVDNFKTVQKNVSGMAGSILDAATNVGNLATNAIGDPINALNNNIGGSYSSVMTLDHTSTTQPANITIGFDKHGYTAYVDDINNQQGKTALLKRNNSVQL